MNDAYLMRVEIRWPLVKGEVRTNSGMNISVTSVIASKSVSSEGYLTGLE